MNHFDVTIPLDAAFDCYQIGKRRISNVPLYCYDFKKNEFTKITEKSKENCVPFINSYTTCCNLIDEYLEQPHVKQYKEDCIKSLKNARYRNKIVDFLWFFEHIDGCYDFENFEIVRMTRVLKKWCKTVGFSYIEPEIYVVQKRH